MISEEMLKKAAAEADQAITHRLREKCAELFGKQNIL